MAKSSFVATSVLVDLLNEKLIAHLRKISFSPNHVLTLNVSHFAQNELKLIYSTATIQAISFSDLTESCFPILDVSVDLLVANLSMINQCDPGILLQDAQRFLSNNGIMIVATFDHSARPFLEKNNQVIIYDEKQLTANLTQIPSFYFSFLKEHLVAIDQSEQFIDGDIFFVANEEAPLLLVTRMPFEHVEIESSESIKNETLTEAEEKTEQEVEIESAENEEHDESEERQETETKHEMEESQEKETQEPEEQTEAEEQHDTESHEMREEKTEGTDTQEIKEVVEAHESQETQEHEVEETEEPEETEEELEKETEHDTLEHIEHHMNEHQEKLDAHAAEITHHLDTLSLMGHAHQNKTVQLTSFIQQHEKMLATYQSLVNQHKQQLAQFIHSQEKTLEHQSISVDKFQQVIDHHKQFLAQHEEKIQQHTEFLMEKK